MSIYDTLNKEQREAVFHTEGPLLILAGAGSGKTRVITHRIAYLLEEMNVNPWNILAITFTNKAAREMRDRVDGLIGFGARSVWVSTFHSMCVRMLRRYVDRLKTDENEYPGMGGMTYTSEFTIYDTDDQKSLIKEVFKTLGINPKEYAPRMVLSVISSAKNEHQTPARFRQEEASDYRMRLIADVYDEYQKALMRNNAMDFDDLLVRTVEMFKSCPEVLEGYRNRFRYIMVDEYQDTNTVQFELVHLLAGEHGNLCVVGDDDQSIYKFRGANIRNILDFEKVYPDAFSVRLEQNYRSTQNVLDAANAVIRNNENRKAKRLWTDHGEGDKIRFREFYSAPEEAAFVAEDIARRMRSMPRASYRDFAILYRTNAQSRLLEEKLLMEAIPYDIVGGVNFYERREIKDMLAYLKTIDNARDDLAVSRILNVPRRGIGQTTIGRINEYARVQDVDLFTALEYAGNIPAIGAVSRKIVPFVELIYDLRAFSKTATLAELLQKILDTTGYEEEIRNSYEEDAEDRIRNIGELISKAVAFEENFDGRAADGIEDEAGGESGGFSAQDDTGLPGRSVLSAFLEEVALISDIDEYNGDDPNAEGGKDKVVMMTLHMAKGLEFPHVYMTGMEEGLFPSGMAIDSFDDDEIEEERRLAYVGITRAKDDLTLCCAASRMLRGEVHYSPVSRFVREIPVKLLDEAPEKKRADAGSFGSDVAGRSYEAPFKASPLKDRRPKAVYVKPHTAEERKPFIAKSLSDLKKGMPEQAGTKPDYEVGDRVEHIKYGTGTVLKLEEGPRDYKVTVMFDEAGQKIMYAAFARLIKLG